MPQHQISNTSGFKCVSTPCFLGNRRLLFAGGLALLVCNLGILLVLHLLQQKVKKDVAVHTVALARLVALGIVDVLCAEKHYNVTSKQKEQRHRRRSPFWAFARELIGPRFREPNNETINSTLLLQIFTSYMLSWKILPKTAYPSGGSAACIVMFRSSVGCPWMLYLFSLNPYRIPKRFFCPTAVGYLSSSSFVKYKSSRERELHKDLTAWEDSLARATSCRRRVSMWAVYVLSEYDSENMLGISCLIYSRHQLHAITIYEISTAQRINDKIKSQRWYMLDPIGARLGTNIPLRFVLPQSVLQLKTLLNRHALVPPLTYRVNAEK